jgi:recombination protein RecA
MDARYKPPTKIISTGSLRLDIALGIGGIPSGQMIQISGPSVSGKTTLCQHLIAEAQKAEGDNRMCAIIDADHAFDSRYAALCGVSLEKLYLCEPSSAEQALDILETLCASGAFSILVLDSVSKLVPAHEINSPIGTLINDKVDILLAKSLHRLSPILQDTGAILVITSQPEPGMSKVYHGLKSNPARLALPLRSSIRICLEPDQEVVNEQSGIQVKAQVVKNKFAPCYKAAQLDIIVNKGVNINGEIYDLGMDLGLFERFGSMYYYKTRPLGENHRAIIQSIQSDDSLAEEIRQVIRQEIPSGFPDLKA